jgi:protein gp37
VGSNKGIGRINEIINLTTEDWKCIFFISIEPLYEKPEIPFLESLKYFDWVIVGGESGNEKGNYRYRPCELEWIEAIIEECEEYMVPVFVKQLGTHLSKTMGLKDRHGKDISEWPEHLQVRQFTADYRMPF